MNQYSFILLILGGLYLVSFLLWAWTLSDCLRKETDKKNTRLIWVLLIVFTYILGAFFYYLLRRPKRLKELGK
ncbi:MAG: PLD nuclease N-terminal domain-containing protein [Methanosarcinaceae archaeon]|nr:PLD nuclease N-terminal domain-containing protein [Methanosarcinaceae archaeon]MDD4331196.1 PLD nuclease N-terminal domain-containing protein [Methanosarcinaceae archaeon]MDD4748422.1 PLD nuclease N-terminal domain-containing protein [Methanosarcinaceae archaeon]